MRRLMALLIGMLALLALAAGPALAQEYPPTTGTTTVSDSSVEAGETITVSGEGFLPGSEVTITFDGQVLGIAAVRADGTFSTQVTIPCVDPGTYELAVTGTSADGTARIDTNQITVTEACPGDAVLPDTGEVGGDGLADTGLGVTNGMTLAAGLLVVGAGALFVARRRSSDSGS